MTDALSSRLAEAIDEAAAIAAAKGVNTPDPSRPSRPGLTYVGTHPAVSAFRKTFNPAAILRLCQAHREIVEQWQTARGALDMAQGAGDDALTSGCALILSVYDNVLKALAKAYGIEEDSSGHSE